MRTPLPALDDLQIASPCRASWDAMAGDDRARFCGECQKHVYDLSRLTAAEAAALIEAKEGRVCVRLYRRWDGTVLTADCPVGLSWRALRRPWRLVRSAAVAAFTAVVAFVGLGCPTKDHAIAGGICPPPGQNGGKEKVTLNPVAKAE